MSTTHQDKSSGKPRQRGRKIDQRGQKSERQPSPKPDARDQITADPMMQTGAMVAPADLALNEAVAPSKVPLIGDVPLSGEVLPPDVSVIGEAMRTDNVPFGIQAIANAYADYTKQSHQESRFFVERLMGVRSFDQAIEVQTEFARQAYANLMAESQNICALYSELARQIFRPWESLLAKMIQPSRQITR